MPLLDFLSTHRSELLTLFGQHLMLIGMSTIVAILIGVPAGIAAARLPRLGRAVVGIVNVAQTIPSLALLGFLLPLPLIGGVGPRVAVTALILYALLPIVRATVVGLNSVDPVVRAAGVAMGMTSRQLLLIVELPLALSSIVSGIRVATVIGVGTATIAAAVGAGGLGDYIFRGLATVDTTMILAGAIPAALLALAADALLTVVERALGAGRGRRWRMPVAVTGVAIVSALLVAGIVAARQPDTVIVGSKNFTEQVILGELLAQRLEREGVRVTRKLNLGGTFICDQALRSGSIDVYAEYTGTALSAIFKEPIGGGREDVMARTRRRYAASGITLASRFGFENTFAVLVRAGDAARYQLSRISDLRRVAATFQPGFGFEFVARQDGYAGLTAKYDLAFSRPPRAMDLSLMYKALADGDVDVVAGDATSALIDVLDLTMLEDDLRYFPPYDAVALARTPTLLRRPEVARALASLDGAITVEDMRAMNRAVDVDKKPVATVAREFLNRRRQGSGAAP